MMGSGRHSVGIGLIQVAVGEDQVSSAGTNPPTRGSRDVRSGGRRSLDDVRRHQG